MPRATTSRPAVPKIAARPPRSRCPVSCTLELVGDRWSLLVVRDLFRGKHRFGEFLESPEAIPTNILTERLKRLVHAGIVSSRRYCSHPPRMEYALTTRGEDLRPILRAMVDWGVAHAGGQVPPGVGTPVEDNASPAPSRTRRTARPQESPAAADARSPRS